VAFPEYARFLLPSADAEVEPGAEAFLPLPDLDTAELVLPLRHRRACAYAVENWTQAESVPSHVKRAVARTLLRAGLMPPVRPLLKLGTDGQAPFLVSAARELGVPGDAGWFLLNGQGRAFRRGAFLLFQPGSSQPEWALKFSQARGDTKPFERDERGLGLAAQAGEVITAHAPRLLGRVEAGGFHASLESAATGRRLDHVLGARDVPRARKRALVEHVAGWAVEVLSATGARASPSLPDAPGELVSAISSVPAVFQHNDLWTWHVLLAGDSFSVIDWEFASDRALPLWDLWYLLYDSAAQIERVGGGQERMRFFVRLFRGEEPLSPLLFEWTRRAVAALSLEPEAVGPLATLVWLQYGSIYAERLGERHLADPSVVPTGRRLPELWLSEPGLGPGWSAWRG
jgi:Phosphotransferase enzyme family